MSTAFKSGSAQHGRKRTKDKIKLDAAITHDKIAHSGMRSEQQCKFCKHMYKVQCDHCQ